MGSDATRKASLHAGIHPRNILQVIIILLVLLASAWMIRYTITRYNEAGIGQGRVVSPTCWVPQGRVCCAPTFIVAGAMKCGTTSLWSYLQSHPEVLGLASSQIDPQELRSVVAEKEVRFFNSPAYDQLVKEYGKASAIDFYLDIFPLIPPPDVRSRDLMLMTNQGRITGEATPMYINIPDTASHVKEALPHVKIIMLLRNPIDRAYSDYWFRKNLKIRQASDSARWEPTEGRTHSEMFEQCMNMEFDVIEYCGISHWAQQPSIEAMKSYHACVKRFEKQITNVNMTNPFCEDKSARPSLCLSKSMLRNCQNMGLVYGLYAPHLYEWTQIFPQENMLVMSSEYFFNYTSQAMDQVTDFLRIGRKNWSDIAGKKFNIVNPGSVMGSRQTITGGQPDGKNALRIGESDHTSENPPLDPQIRARLLRKMAPYNQMISLSLPNPIYSDWEN